MVRVPFTYTLFTLQSGARSASYPSGPASRLDLCYVAERMLALHLPDRDAHAEAQAAHMLTNKHGEHFMVSYLSLDFISSNNLSKELKLISN